MGLRVLAKSNSFVRTNHIFQSTIEFESFLRYFSINSVFPSQPNGTLPPLNPEIQQEKKRGGRYFDFT